MRKKYKADWRCHTTVAGDADRRIAWGMWRSGIMGQVLTAGAGQMPARQAAVAAGIPMSVPSLSINKVCLSGRRHRPGRSADPRGRIRRRRRGRPGVDVPGTAHAEESREGFKYGDVTMRDHMAYDGLHDVFTDQAMGLLTEQVNERDKFTRAEQDAFAALPPERRPAWKDGLFDDEVVPVSIPQRKGDPIVFAEDEGIRADTTVESLAGLARVQQGRHRHRGLGLPDLRRRGRGGRDEQGQSRRARSGWIAEIGAHGVVAGPDSTLQSQPANAIAKACAKEGITPDHSTSSRSTRRSRPSGSPRRGSSASTRQGQRQRRRHRHRAPARHVRCADRAAPRTRVGATRRRHAAAALCGGGGQGDALILRRP